MFILHCFIALWSYKLSFNSIFVVNSNDSSFISIFTIREVENNYIGMIEL